MVVIPEARASELSRNSLAPLMKEGPGKAVAPFQDDDLGVSGVYFPLRTRRSRREPASEHSMSSVASVDSVVKRAPVARVLVRVSLPGVCPEGAQNGYRSRT
jgi:hypothetical protein